MFIGRAEREMNLIELLRLIGTLILHLDEYTGS
jgi:hypothetical protein